MEQVKYNKKVAYCALCCINNECRMTIGRGMNGVAHIYMLLTPEPFCHPSRI